MNEGMSRGRILRGITIMTAALLPLPRSAGTPPASAPASTSATDLRKELVVSANCDCSFAATQHWSRIDFGYERKRDHGFSTDYPDWRQAALRLRLLIRTDDSIPLLHARLCARRIRLPDVFGFAASTTPSGAARLIVEAELPARVRVGKRGRRVEPEWANALVSELRGLRLILITSDLSAFRVTLKAGIPLVDERRDGASLQAEIRASVAEISRESPEEDLLSIQNELRTDYRAELEKCRAKLDRLMRDPREVKKALCKHCNGTLKVTFGPSWSSSGSSAPGTSGVTTLTRLPGGTCDCTWCNKTGRDLEGGWNCRVVQCERRIQGVEAAIRSADSLADLLGQRK